MRTFYRMCVFLQHFSALQHSPNDWFFSCQQQIQCIWHRWKRKPIFLPGEFHRQRSLAGYSPRGRTESDMTEQLRQTGIDGGCFVAVVVLVLLFLFAFVFLFLEEKERRGILFQKLEMPKDQMHSFFWQIFIQALTLFWALWWAWKLQHWTVQYRKDVLSLRNYIRGGGDK